MNKIIRFGKWDNNPIEWLVLKEDDFGMLVVSKNSLFTAKFNNSSNNPEWKDSDIRKYLNGDFFDKAFSDIEKKKVMNAFLSDVDSKDDVFLLSDNEANSYITRDDRRSISSQRWWLRTKRETYYLWGVDMDGAVDRKFNSNDTQGTHPAVYLKK